MTTATGSLTVGNVLAFAAQRHRDREMLACMTTGRRFTFAQVNERANRLANGLAAAGIARGDVVAFLCNNRAEIVEIYFGLAKLGAVGMPINYRLSPPEIADLCRTVNARALIVAPRFQSEADAVRTGDNPIEQYITIGDDVPHSATGYEDLLAAAPADEPRVPIEEADPQYFNLTSGTTGSPKTYVLNHYNNAMAGLLMSRQFGLTVDDSVLTVFPMFGRVGFAWTIGALMAGARKVITDFEPASVSRIIEQESCTIVNLVPTMAQMLIQAKAQASADLSSLRGIVFAGSPLPASVFTATRQELCPHIFEYYGMQETGVVVDIEPAEKLERPGSVGRVSAFSQVRVVDPDSHDLPAGENGAIIVRTPTATTGYFNNPAKTQETFRDGWIHTGDIGRFDDEGYLYITGRAKDVIVTGGQNVFAVEVEDRLLSHPAVQDCSVIGLQDELWGEVVTAVIVPEPGATVSDDEIIAFCREGLAGFKTPKRIVRRSEPIPRTPTGKVTKHTLLEEYSAG